VVALVPTVFTIPYIELMFRGELPRSLAKALTSDASAVLAIGHVALAQRKVYRPEFSLSQFGTVTVAKPILTVLKVAAMLREGRLASLGLAQT